MTSKLFFFLSLQPQVKEFIIQNMSAFVIADTLISETHNYCRSYFTKVKQFII